MIGEKIVILDLGSNKIKIMVLSLDKENYISIHSKNSVHSSGIKKGNVVDADSLASSIRRCASLIENELNFEIENIYVGVNSIFFNFLTFGLTRDIGSYEIEEKRDLQNLINQASTIFYQNFNDNKVLHFFNSGFYLDKRNYVENPIGLRAKTLDVIFSILSLDKNIISNYDKVFKLSGLKVKKYFFSPYASSFLSADQENLEKGFVNIDIGYDKTSISIYENSKFKFSKIISLGSYHINNDLMKALDIDRNLSEKIKCKYDDILLNNIDQNLLNEINEKKISREIIVRIIDARLNEITEHIVKEIKFCNSFNKSSRKIIVSGGGSASEVLIGKISQKLNVKVDYAKQSFPIKNTEFSIFSDYMVCLGIAKLIYFNNKDEIKSYSDQKKGFFERFYSLFLK
jgi:cell division protein FtsA